jgi:hypothetical protein
VLLARSRNKLEELARELETVHGIQVAVVAADLSEPDAPQAVFDELLQKALEIERDRGRSLKIEDIQDQVSGVYPKIMIEGDMDAGAWSCGMVAGLIRDIPTVKELIDRIMADAERLILDRLAGLLGAGSKVALKVA